MKRLPECHPMFTMEALDLVEVLEPSERTLNCLTL